MKRPANVYQDSAPHSSLVADQEVAGEEGGWRNTNLENNNNNSSHQDAPAAPSALTSYIRHDDEAHNLESLRINQELPIIDLLSDVDDNIAFKSEPASPKMEEGLEACLLSDDTPAYDQNDDNRLIESAKNNRLGGTFCNFCQKSFSRAWSLQRHLADTHFYVPQSLACDQCGRSYKSRNSLISHKSQYHGKKDKRVDHETNYFHELTY
uniref:C2H2-type domain-containing protein n=1 Tax=Bracon brevicornis TaxID=1563983 RepID=A0A6V7LIQ7_9HYME